jgi:N-acetylmuramoyl-L-alanine amidase
MSRMTNCPVVLTENGFITNKNEFEKMIQDEFNQECAIALAQGVLN